MTGCRDWTASLWPASFKGFPFHVGKEGEDGGRTIIVHEFPGRDDPFLEDMGEGARAFDVTAYLASDTADRDMLAFMAVLTSPGPGLLVLPKRGPVLVRATKPFKRDVSKDKLGFVGFSLRFIREGAASALITLDSSANLVLVAAEAVVAALSSIQPGRGMAYADAVADAVAAIEVIRTTEPVNPEASSSLLRTLRSMVADPASVDAATALPEVLTAIVATMPNERVESILDPIMTFEASDPTVRFAMQAGALASYGEALISREFKDRRAGIAARAAFGSVTDRMMEDASAADLSTLVTALADLSGAMAEWLSLRIVDLAPVITVTAPKSMPSLFWAWRLYADAGRAGEIVDRNRIRHPSFIPETFEALAS